MTHFVTDKCIKCKYTDCVEVCPVDCFYEGKNMLVINPDECIDCGVCIPECPVDAIVTDNEQKIFKSFYNINVEYSQKWPNITAKKQPLDTAEEYKEKKDKTAYFDENSGS
nr:unnamed protein product [Callosobruchus chinensis]